VKVVASRIWGGEVEGTTGRLGERRVWVGGGLAFFRLDLLTWLQRVPNDASCVGRFLLSQAEKIGRMCRSSILNVCGLGGAAEEKAVCTRWVGRLKDKVVNRSEVKKSIRGRRGRTFVWETRAERRWE
jgi:hypothetical protein